MFSRIVHRGNHLASVACRQRESSTARQSFGFARQLSISEYQGRDLLAEMGVPVPFGAVARSLDEVENMVKTRGGYCVLKSQILSGGRGKGHFASGLKGGIQIVRDSTTARSIAAQMLGEKLYTHQNKAGAEVEALLVADKVDYEEEYYLSLSIDRSNSCPVLVVSKQGGINIEQNKASIARELLVYGEGITEDVVSRVAKVLELTSQASRKLAPILERLYKLFAEKDTTLIEINPLARTSSDEFICLDSKVSIDDAAKPRQSKLFAQRPKGLSNSVPETDEQRDEQEAQASGLVYVRLEGNIGNVVNGAGLAMATNDAISYYGGQSANFLDAGGRATTETMVKAFEIILRDERVKVVLVNIYGGITRCDMIAESIVRAAAKLGPLRCPIVVRLQGTNSQEGLDIISQSGLALHSESDFGMAAKKAIELAERL